MIRHVVMFKFKADAAPTREKVANRLRAVLEPLADSVDGVTSLQFGVDDKDIPAHWDAVRISEHTTKEALAAYQQHPDHLEALKAINDLVSAKVVVDYTL